MSNPDQSPANSPLQARAVELHTKAFMPMSQAEELALSELGIDDAAIDELSAEACCTVLLTLLDAEDVRTFTRAILVHQPAATSTQVVAPTEAAAMAATVPAGPDMQRQVLDKLLQLASIVDRAVTDWGESFADGSSTVKFHKEEAEARDAILDFFDELPDGANDQLIESGPVKAARIMAAGRNAQAPVADQPAEPSPAAPPFIHKKSGGRYQFVGLAHLQTDKPLSDMASVTVYRGEDGRLWAREGREFVERFEQEGRPFWLRDDLLAAEQEALDGTGGVLAISPELLAQVDRAAPKGDSNG